MRVGGLGQRENGRFEKGDENLKGVGVSGKTKF